MSTLFNTLTDPKRYLSLIERELQKNRLAPLSEKRDFMKFIPFLPAELRREIFKCIDIETRISMMLEKRPYLVRGPERLPEETLNENKKNPFYSLLSGADFAKIYYDGFVKQIFKYNQQTRRWGLKSEANKLLKTDTIIGIPSTMGTNLRCDAQTLNYNHIVHSTLDAFRKRYSVSGDKTTILAPFSERQHVPISALSLFLKIKYNSEVDYYLRKKGFQFMIATDCYIQNKYEQVRIKKENARREKQQQNEKWCMLDAEKETRVYNKLKEKADKNAAILAKKTARAEQKTTAANAKAEKKAAAIAKKTATANAKAEKKAATATAKELRNNKYYLSKLMGYGRLNL
jgi:hypothetical protein